MTLPLIDTLKPSLQDLSLNQRKKSLNEKQTAFDRSLKSVMWLKSPAIGFLSSADSDASASSYFRF